MTRQTHIIVILVTAACLVLGVVDAILQPGYLVKSLVKLTLFLLLPLVCAALGGLDLKGLLRPGGRGFRTALLAGAGVYLFILLAYLALRNVFDFSAVTAGLDQGVGVTRENFAWVALYISFVNSLLEEFFFRGFAFLVLKRSSTRRFAYLFSAGMFALYHIAMMLGWFGGEVVALAVAGLFIGGCLFNFCDERNGTIWLSWLIHMFANFAINTVGFLLFAQT